MLRNGAVISKIKIITMDNKRIQKYSIKGKIIIIIYLKYKISNSEKYIYMYVFV